MRIPTALLLAGFAGIAACAPGESPRAAEAATPTVATAASPQVLNVHATDFAFQAVDTVAAGLTTIRMINGGHEMHHVQVLRLKDGHTVEDVLGALRAGGPPPAWVEFLGGPNSPVPGEASEATLELEPGQYAIVCFIPSADGVPHLAKGMARGLVVTGDAPGAAAEPAADVRMKLLDYAFEMEGELTAGRRTIRVETATGQPHEVLIARLEPGRTPHDLAAWVETQQGPPPGVPVGGTALLQAGGVNYVTADFEPGEYALLCFVPDAGDGRPHVAHGMMRQITVR